MSVRKRYVRQESPESLLAVAVTKHNSRNTEALLAEGADPNLKYERSPLLFSATIPNLRALLARGAQIDITNEEGYTLLNHLCHVHSGTNETTRIQFLLENGADPNLPDRDGDTPLHNICLGSADLAVIRLLLQHGADPTHENNVGETPLHYLASNVNIIMKPYQEMIQALLAGGVNPNIRDQHNQLPSQRARTVLMEMMDTHITPDQQRFITYLDHIERGIPPPLPAAAAPAAPAAANNAFPAPLNSNDPFNNIPHYNGNHGNNVYHPPPPPPPPNVIRNRPNQPNIVVPIGNNNNNGNRGNRGNRGNNLNQYPVDANSNHAGGRRHRHGQTAKRGKGKSKGTRKSKSKSKGQRRKVRTRRH